MRETGRNLPDLDLLMLLADYHGVALRELLDGERKENTMDYQKMYTTLFNAITDALSQIETQNYGDAKETLISAQQKAEEIYITAQN